MCTKAVRAYTSALNHLTGTQLIQIGKSTSMVLWGPDAVLDIIPALKRWIERGGALLKVEEDKIVLPVEHVQYTEWFNERAIYILDRKGNVEIHDEDSGSFKYITKDGIFNNRGCTW